MSKEKNFHNWMEESIKTSGKPKFKIGDRCVYIGDVGGLPVVLDDNMVIESEASWYDYASHPNKGYYQYSIVGKANECPENFLILYDGQKEGSIIK